MSTDSGTVDILAGGGVLIRGDHPGDAEVAIVRRPRYDDWTIPKGKLDPGEDIASCAVREVWEETGYRARLIGPAGTNRYDTGEGSKLVEYFWMRPYRFTGFTPNREIDAVRWLPLDRAQEMLSYEFDRRLIDADTVAEVLLAHTTIHLIRHADAGDRSGWDGDDSKRPLTATGRRQAEAIAAELKGLGVTRILSSEFDRCRQTAEPLAREIGSKVENHVGLREGAGNAAISDLLEEVAGSTAVLCSHGDVIPDLLHRLQRTGTRFLSPYEAPKGSTWVIGHHGGAFIEARYVPPPLIGQSGI